MAFHDLFPEEFMNPPTCARSRYPDPRTMERQIRAETDSLIQALWADNKLGSPLDENRPIPAGGDGKNVIYIYRKVVMRTAGNQKKYPHIRFKALVGSSLYIALYLKRYEEAAKLLEKAPYSAAPGYAVLPVTIYYRNLSGEQPDMTETDGVTEMDGVTGMDELSGSTGCPPEVAFHLDQAVYLQDMVLLDKGIPDELFVALCRRLIERKESGVIDLPCRYEGRIGERKIRLKAEEPDEAAAAHWGYADRSCGVPALLREFAGRTDLKRHYGELTHVDKDWAEKIHSAEETQTYQESVLSDESLFWEVLKGLERLKKLDEGLFHSWVDERTAAHFLIKYMFIIFDILWSYYAVAEKSRKTPKRLEEMKKPINVPARAFKLRAVLKGLGHDEVTADTFWDAVTDYGYGAAATCNGFWAGLELWRLVFQKELVLEVKEEVTPLGSDDADRGVMLFAAMFYCEAEFERADPKQDGVLKYVYPKDGGDPIQSSKCFLEMVNQVQWKTDGAGNQEMFLKHRHAVEELVLGTKDKELLYMCVEKNIFPASDMMFLSERVSEELGDLLPLMVMKQHGYL